MAPFIWCRNGALIRWCDAQELTRRRPAWAGMVTRLLRSTKVRQMLVSLNSGGGGSVFDTVVKWLAVQQASVGIVVVCVSFTHQS
jgi:hypothetical protein